MSKPPSLRRMAENQVVFRRLNEQIPKGLGALEKAAKSEGHGELIQNTDMPLHFYCECSDENCRQRIILKTSEYKRLHQSKRQFVIIPGHEVPEIERSISKTKKYMVVEKFEKPDQKVSKLQPTAVDNA